MTITSQGLLSLKQGQKSFELFLDSFKELNFRVTPMSWAAHEAICILPKSRHGEAKSFDAILEGEWSG